MINQKLKLNFSGSIEIACKEIGKEWYEELKIFLKEADPKFILNGQIIKTLELCCPKNNGDNHD